MTVDAWLAVRGRVAADPALQAQLWPLDATAFRAQLTELGAPAEGGWPWDPGPLFMPISLNPAPLLAKPPAGPGWVPVGLELMAGPPRVIWRHTGGQRPVAGLYPSDVQAWSRRPLNRFLDAGTHLDTLDEDADGPPPAGIIFHMSRCGSTLASRMLAQITGVVSLSEPRILGDILRIRRFDPDFDPARQVAWLRSVAARSAAGGAKVVIKTEAGGLFGLDLLRRAFPDTPWIFLHRDPLDVMLSQALQRSSEMMPIMIEAALPASSLEASDIDLDEHCARTLGALCAAAADAIARADGAAIPYEGLADAVATRIAPLFGLQPDADDLERMRAVATRHARRGEETFVDEQSDRRAGADGRLVALADEFARPAWRRLA